MTTGSHKKEFAANKGKTPFLFLLAALMLVVSCPFKRLLQAENNVQATAKQSIRGNSAERQGTAYKNISCCTQKQNITLANPVLSTQKLQAPDLLIDQHKSGFSIHYFLSGTKKQSEAIAISSLYPLPLFLQHRRLLI